jgi:hypothetical protein
MSKIEEFKSFVRTNPSLIKEVTSNKVSWQKLYEVWDISGPSADVWKDYGINKETNSTDNSGEESDFHFNDIVKMVKNINLQSVQKGINNLQKAIIFFQQMGSDKSKPIAEDVYVPRPMYKHFED